MKRVGPLNNEDPLNAMVKIIAIVLGVLLSVVTTLSVVNVWRIDREDTSSGRVEKTKPVPEITSEE